MAKQTAYNPHERAFSTHASKPFLKAARGLGFKVRVCEDGFVWVDLSPIPEAWRENVLIELRRLRSAVEKLSIMSENN